MTIYWDPYMGEHTTDDDYPKVKKTIGNHERRTPRHKPFLTLKTINGMTIAKKAHPQVVVVIPITEDNGIVLANQFRVGVNSNVIGLPAGHVGDDPGHENENIIEAAKRELLEETGYGGWGVCVFRQRGYKPWDDR